MKKLSYFVIFIPQGEFTIKTERSWEQFAHYTIFLFKLYLSSGVTLESIDFLYKSLEMHREQVSEQD